MIKALTYFRILPALYILTGAKNNFYTDFDMRYSSRMHVQTDLFYIQWNDQSSIV